MKEDLIKTKTPDIPVYLFTGFLDAGKTKFIQDTLEDKRFSEGEKTLLILCEEGETEYSPEKFCKKGETIIRTVENEEDMTVELLQGWQDELKIERVVVEFNGMWMLDTLYQNLPERWTVYQEFMFAEAGSFLDYNSNMRQLVYDKLRSCELVVFNRFVTGADIMPFHKIVRGINRGCDIAYETPDGKVKYDEIEDPLPFDIKAPVVEIQDRDYAIWYRDLGEELKKYDGKTVRFKGQVAKSDELPADSFIIGRNVMSCCEADASFAGLIVEKSARTSWESSDWIMLTAKIKVKRHPGYDRVGPVLAAIETAAAAPPEEITASFY